LRKNSVVTFAAAVTHSAAETFNGVVTMTSDLIVGWVKNQSSVNAYQYEKIKIVAGKLPNSTGSLSMAHGISDWHSIKSYTAIVEEDSLNRVLACGNFYGTDILFYSQIDSINCVLVLGGSAVALKNDSVFFRIVYTDFSR